MKITKTLSLLLVAFGIISFSFITDDVKKIIPGKGTDEVAIGVTTKDALQAIYGPGFIEKKHYSKKGDDSVLFSTSLHFEKAGIKAWIKAADKTVFSLYFYPNYSAVTEKGIRAGVSTMSDVLNAYGKSEWYTSGNYMFLEYEGIAFNIPFDGKFPIKKSTYRKAKKTKVTFISIKEIE
ncbi:MAG: hypothetical protein ABIQ40_13730 [Bacteroidia bacterium]